MKNIILTIDIGNTCIVSGLFKESRLFEKFAIPTNAKDHAVRSIFGKKLSPHNIESAIVSSVVPPVSKTVVDILKKRLGIKTLLLGRDIKVPIRNLYKRPEQVGQDRLVSAYACLKLYGVPAIIIDFGTATTFDYVDSKGSYAGGLITPGAAISLEALAERTALLPKIELKKPKELLGKDTADSMRSGILFGLSSMCDGVIDKLKRRYSKRAIVVATGGLSGFFASHCKKIDRIDKWLILRGLYLIYHDENSVKNAIPTP